MTIPCEQAANISDIKSTLTSMDNYNRERLDRMERVQERLVVTLEKVAEQSVRINSLENDNEHRTQDISAIYDRVRKVELSQEHLDIFLAIVTNKAVSAAVIALLVMVLTGTVLDMVCHNNPLTEIRRIFK